MSIKQENLSFYNQSKLIPEIGDTIQVTPTGVKTRIDLSEHPLLKDALLKLRENSAAVVDSAGSNTTTSVGDVIDVDDVDENVAANTTSVEEGKELSSSSSIWDEQQKQMMFWEKNLSDFISTSLLSLTQSSSSSSSANPNVTVNNNNSNLNKPMVFPKTALEVGANTESVLKASQRGNVNMLFTMKKKTNDSEKKQLHAVEDASFAAAAASAITSDMTFAFTEDASPAPATTQQQEPPSDKANDDANGESKNGTNADATATSGGGGGGSVSDKPSEWDFSTVRLFKHPNYTAKCARLKKITTCINGDDASSQTKSDDAQKLEGTHQDSAPASSSSSSSTAFSTLVFLGEDRLKVHVERDRKLIRNLEAKQGRYLFSLVRLDNLLFGLVFPVIDYDILMSGGGGGEEDNADESVSSSASLSLPASLTKTNNNNNNNNNNNSPSFLVRSFTGQRVTLRPPSDDPNMKRFKAESKLSYPELADCVDPSVAASTNLSENNNNNINNTKNNIYYSTTSPETFSKILSMSNNNGNDNNSNQQNSRLIYGTIVEIRRHVKFATQFVACVLVDAPKLGGGVSSGSKAAEYSECPLFSSFLQVSSSIPRFFVACHSSELLPLPPTSQQRQQQASNNNDGGVTTTTSSSTSTSAVAGSKRRERVNANSQIAGSNNKNTEESKSVTKDLAAAAPKTPLNSAAAVVPANKTTKSTTAVTAGISLSANSENSKAASSTQNLNNNNNNNGQQQQSGLPQQDFQKLLKTIYGVDVASPDEAARIVSDGVPEKQETYNAHVFRSKFFSRNPTTVLKTALTLHSCLIGPQSGGGQFRRMYGTGIGAWALNNISHQQQQQQGQGQASKQQNAGNTALTTKSHAAKMFG